MEEPIKDNGGNGTPIPPTEPQEERKPKDLVLTITVHADSGQLTVQGPGNGKMFDEPTCLWMLHKAGRFIESMNARAMQPKIIEPNPTMTQQMRGMFNRNRRG